MQLHPLRCFDNDLPGEAICLAVLSQYLARVVFRLNWSKQAIELLFSVQAGRDPSCGDALGPPELICRWNWITGGITSEM